MELENLPLRRSTRIPQHSTRLRDFVTYKVQYSIQDFLSYKKITPEYKVFLPQFQRKQNQIIIKRP
jgi:hypothetical protein